MKELSPEEINIPKDMIAWILKRLNPKDSAEFMLALSVGKPNMEHTHQWILGGTYTHSHKRGDIPHGHHGSTYVKPQQPEEEICPECLGRRQVERIPVGSFGVPAGLTICPKCQGKGKAPKADKLRERLIDYMTDYKDAAERNALAETPEESADYLIALFDDVEKQKRSQIHIEGYESGLHDADRDNKEKAKDAKANERQRIVNWIDEHNACSIEHGLNIGSGTWQPFRQGLRD